MRAVGRVLARRELLARQLHLAPRAHETFLQTNITYLHYLQYNISDLVPGLPPEGDSARGEHLLALDALGRDLVLEAAHAEDVLVVGDDEGLAVAANLGGADLDT